MTQLRCERCGQPFPVTGPRGAKPMSHARAERRLQRCCPGHGADRFQPAGLVCHIRLDALVELRRQVRQRLEVGVALPVALGRHLKQRLQVVEVLVDRAQRHPGALGDQRRGWPDVPLIDQVEHRVHHRVART